MAGMFVFPDRKPWMLLALRTCGTAALDGGYYAGSHSLLVSGNCTSDRTHNRMKVTLESRVVTCTEHLTTCRPHWETSCRRDWE